jgi:hypothetical protein
MGTTANGLIIKPVSESDAQKIVTLNAGTDDFDAVTMGMLNLSIAGTGNITLTRTQAMTTLQKFTGVLTGNRTVFFPVSLGSSRIIWVWNATSGAFSVTFLTTTGGSTGVTVTQGKKVALGHDGTNVFKLTTEV